MESDILQLRDGELDGLDRGLSSCREADVIGGKALATSATVRDSSSLRSLEPSMHSSVTTPRAEL